MKWTINSDITQKHGLNIDEFTLLLFLARGGKIERTISSLYAKKWIESNKINYPFALLTQENIEKVQNILLDSELKENNNNIINFDSLANQLKEIFPKGNKPGTNYSWRGSTAEIAKKLKNLVVKYNCKFTEEEAIEATKAYVASFNGDYRYMKLLKYFLLKIPVNNNGDVEIESEFMSYLENKDVAEHQNNNWTIDLA